MTLLICIAVLGMATLPGATADSVHDFKLADIDGKTRSLADYKGKVIVAVNVASKCGMTPQYEGLEALYRSKKAAGLVVLGFPANEFGNQEPGSNEEIKEFCSTKYNVTFPMFSKIVVKGPGIHPLYKYLVSQTSGQEIEWNFAKFVIGKDGKVRARFSSRTKPDDPAFLKAIDKALAE